MSPWPDRSSLLADPKGATAEAPTWTRYYVLALLCLAAAIAYIGRNCINVAATEIREELQIPLVSMGWVMGAFFWGYALAQIPAGWLGHVWGVRRALSLYALVWSLACGAVALAAGPWSLIIAQLVFGVSQAGIFPCSAAVIPRWLPFSRRALAGGSLGSFMSVGGAIGASLTGLALTGVAWHGLTISPISWRWVFVMFALPGVGWAVWFYCWFRDRPEDHSAVNAAELAVIRGESPAPQKPDEASHEPVPWAAVAGSFDMWMICGQQFFRAAGYIFFATWFPTFLRETRGVTTAASGYLTSLPLLAVVAGCLIGGLIVDYIWSRTGSRRLSRQGVAITAMLGCAAFSAAALMIDDALVAVLLIAAGSFFAALGGSCGYAITIDKGGRHVAPIFGAMNMSGNFGAALCPVVVAWIVAWTDNWNLVLVFFAGVYLCAALCWALLNPGGTFVNDRNEVQP